MSESNSMDRSTAPGSRIPTILGWSIISVAFVLLVFVRVLGWQENQPFLLDDPAIRNLVSLICLFAIGATVWGWFCFVSAYSAAARRAVTVAPFVLIALGLAVVLLRRPTGVIQFSGSMMPRFAPTERKLDSIQSSSSTIDLKTTTADDFPQFLGPDRGCWIAAQELAKDWSDKQPRLLWKRPVGAGWSGFAAVNGHAVTIEQRGAEETVTCYSIDTGEPEWGHAITARHEQAMGGIGPRSTPTIHQGRVFTLGATGVLQCLDGSNGTVLWSDDLRKRYEVSALEDEAMVMWGRSASPLIVDAMVVVPGGGPVGKAKNLVAFEAESGKLLWESQSLKEDGIPDQIGYASPGLATIAGRRQILIVNETTASGHDPATGNMLWSYPWPSHSNGDACASQAVAIDDSHLFLSKGYSTGAELIELSGGGPEGRLTAKSLWKMPKVLQTKFTNVVIQDGHAYGLSEGILECVEVASGKRKWKAGRYGHGQILGVGDQLLVLSEEGELSLVDASPKALTSRGTLQALTGKTWNTLCLYGKRLLVRNAEEAACYELP